MESIEKKVRDEIRELIIEKNGKLFNRDITPIYQRYKPVVGNSIVTIILNACNYFRFDPSQAEFRKQYNYE